MSVKNRNPFLIAIKLEKDACFPGVANRGKNVQGKERVNAWDPGSD